MRRLEVQRLRQREWDVQRLSLLEKGKDLLSSLVFSSLNMNYRFSVSLKKLVFFFCFCIYSVIWEIFDIFTV